MPSPGRNQMGYEGYTARRLKVTHPRLPVLLGLDPGSPVPGDPASPDTVRLPAALILSMLT
jgi:hypothetical protein